MDLFSFSDMSLDHVPSYAGITSKPSWSQLTNSVGPGLVEQLQTSLDLAQQLQIYSMAAGKILPLSALEMHTAVGIFQAAGSYAGAHEYRSMLVLNEQCLAELVYQSGSAFSPLMQRRLLELETQWLFPLRNALVVTRLQQLALKDTLTGLGNRRFFDDSFSKTVLLAERKQQPCALILLDLDNFKPVNDNHGHHAGDEVLLAVADAMRSTLRISDNLFRFGGDEFAVLLTAEDAYSAELVAHRLVKAISQHHICEKFGVSASAGLAQLQQQEDSKLLFARADQALYQAKQSGKNAVRHAQPHAALDTVAELIKA
jgi:two-component system, cell cycle response regulator